MTINDHGKTFAGDKKPHALPAREGGKGKVSATRWATYAKWSLLAVIMAPLTPAAGIIHSGLSSLF